MTPPAPRTWDAVAIAAYFLLGPVYLAALWLLAPGADSPWGVPGWRAGLTWGVAAPFVGTLLARRSRRARFSAYIFLSLDIVRSAVHGHLALLVADLVVLAYLQLPRMRRVYPTIDPARILARWTTRNR